MRIIYYVLVTGVSAMVTWGFSVVILKLSHRYQLYPKIRSRDVHTQPTPRLGGVAMFLGVLVAMGVASLVPQLQPVFEDPEQILTILAAAFVIVVLGVGFAAKRYIKTSLDYFLSGRSLPAWTSPTPPPSSRA